MELTYDLTQKDFYDAFVAHGERSVFLKWGRRLRLGFIFLFTLITPIGLLTLAKDHQIRFVSVVPLLAFWAISIWGLPWWSGRTQFLKQAAQGFRTMTLDGSGIHWRWQGGQADVEWTNFVRFLESKTLFLLYASPSCYNIVPKRAFAPGGTESFRELLQEKLGTTMAAHRKRVSPQLIVFLVVVAFSLVVLVQVILTSSSVQK